MSAANETNGTRTPPPLPGIKNRLSDGCYQIWVFKGPDREEELVE
jgi:hypothetical protein